MGGKNKGMRTKNNARPSSSARSAELLGDQVPSFLGFMTGKNGPNLTIASDDLDTCVDIEFQLVFKKMIKKDATTKLKALNECCVLCTEADVEKTKSILPFWPRLYNQLANDSEHRVREAAHITHKAIVGKVRKYLAPFLKEIIGPWYTSQFDTYAPAASAAAAAFNEAFSPAKLTEAIAYCQENILEYIIQNITVPPTQGPSKTVTPEDLENNHRRILSSSLLSYASYLQTIKMEQLKNCEGVNKRLLSLTKFWKLCQHKEPMVRFGFFKAFVSIVQHALFLLADESTRVAAVLLNYLGEDDPVVLPSVWDAVLHGLVAFPECWTNSNVEKQLLPKLFLILKSGGKGGSRYIFPNILPLLSQMPDSVVGDKSIFYTKLFASMRAGLEETSVNRSLSESRVVAGTMIECIQYVVQKYNNDTEFVESVIKNQLIEAIKSRLAATTPPNQATLPYTFHLALLLRNWHRNESTYREVTCFFWRVIEQLFVDMLENVNVQAEAETILKSQLDFLSILQCPGKFNPKNNKDRVRFVSEENDQTVPLHKADVNVEEFNAALSTFVVNIAKNYFRLFKITGFEPFLEKLAFLTRNFNGSSIIQAIAGDDGLFSFFTDLLLLKVPNCILMELSGVFLPMMIEIEQLRVLQSLLNGIGASSSILFCKGVSQCNSPVVRSWLGGEKFSGFYLKLMDQFLSGSNDLTDAEVICSFLSPNLMISETALAALLDAMVRTLDSTEKNNYLDRLGYIINACPQSIYLLPAFGQFLAKLFAASCEEDGGTSAVVFNNLLTRTTRFRYGDKLFWEELPTNLMNKLNYKTTSVDQCVSVISKYIQITEYFDPSELCEPEEITATAKIIESFLKPSDAVKSAIQDCRTTIKVIAEARADVNLQYFKLELESKEKELTQPDFAIDEVTDELIDWVQKHLSPVTTKRQIIFSEDLQIYLKWLQIVGGLLDLLKSAYPRSAEYRDFSIPGRYHIEGEKEPNDSSDVIPRIISKEKYDQLEEKVTIMSSAYSDDEYPDENLLGSLTMFVLHLVQGAAAFDKMKMTSSETKEYSVISSSVNALIEQTQEVIFRLTGTEFDYIYEISKRLVHCDSVWCCLLPQLTQLLYRRFSGMGVSSTYDDVPEMVDMALNGGLTEYYNAVKLIAAIKTNPAMITRDQWTRIFLETDAAMTAACVNWGYVSKEVNQFAVLFTTIKSTLELSTSNDEQTYADALNEWKIIVEPELWQHMLYKFWINLKNVEENIQHCVHYRNVCEAVVAGIRPFDSELRIPVLELVEICTAHLLSPSLPLQISAFHVLLSLVPELVREDLDLFQGSMQETPVDGEKGVFSNVRVCQWRCKMLEPTLVSSQTVVDALLSDFKIGDTCEIQAYTDAFTYAHGYLLLWCVFIEFWERSHAALNFQYASWLKRDGHLTSILEAVLKLMPAHIVHGEVLTDAHKNKVLFHSYGDMRFSDEPCNAWLEQRACFVYRMCLQHMAVAVREWWSSCDHHVSAMIAEATSVHVSPILIASELKKAGSASVGALDKITVTVNPITKEICGTYTIDEAIMTIVITLPPNYPLGAMKVELNSQSIVSLGQRIHMFLAHRNGSLCDALALWMSHLNKKYEKLEECEICFSILRGPRFEVPNKSCTTCRKIFHSACLYKWFSVSNKSSCPHCRNLY